MKPLVLFATALLLCSATVYAEVETNVKQPLTMMAYVPCAAGGAGEMVALGGEIHVVVATTMSASGRLTLTTHFQPQGVSGQGLTTGEKYHGTGVTRSVVQVDPVEQYPFVTTYVNNFRIIGQGSGNNLLIHVTMHVTINANGTATAQVDNPRSSCK